jgi:hypothetical protein
MNSVEVDNTRLIVIVASTSTVGKRMRARDWAGLPVVHHHTSTLVSSGP